MYSSCLLLCLLLTVTAMPNYPKEEPKGPRLSYDKPKPHKGMPYKYGWGVEESGKGLNYGQNEESDGSVVTGQYRVLLPDGRTQIVSYRADHESGFVAEVRYEGEARPYAPPPKPSYRAKH